MISRKIAYRLYASHVLCLKCTVSAIHGDDRAADEAGLVRCQEQYGIDDFLRLPKPLHGVVAGDTLLMLLGVLLQEIGYIPNVCADGAGGDGIDAHAVRRQIQCPATSEILHRRLGPDIHGEVVVEVGHTDGG